MSGAIFYEKFLCPWKDLNFSVFCKKYFGRARFPIFPIDLNQKFKNRKWGTPRLWIEHAIVSAEGYARPAMPDSQSHNDLFTIFPTNHIMSITS